MPSIGAGSKADAAAGHQRDAQIVACLADQAQDFGRSGDPLGRRLVHAGLTGSVQMNRASAAARNRPGHLASR